MADEIKLSIGGIDELKRQLADLPEKLRRRGLLNALRRAARVIREAARAKAPVLAMPVKYRTPGLVRRKISVRTSKFARQAGDVGVFVGVRPALGAKFRGGVQVRASARGARSPQDPFYWRFVEFGTRKMRARPYLTPAGDRLGEALGIFERDAVDVIEKLNRKT
jgi:HK97 gp10 family phage protein